MCRKLCDSLIDSGLSTLMDVTEPTIGKRYARTDEIGVPFAVTVDHDALQDNTATLRERGHDVPGQGWAGGPAGRGEGSCQHEDDLGGGAAQVSFAGGADGGKEKEEPRRTTR